jgi:hypothetical protein
MLLLMINHASGFFKSSLYVPDFTPQLIHSTRTYLLSFRTDFWISLRRSLGMSYWCGCKRARLVCA